MEDKTKKVLIIDDDEFILDMYAMKFSNAGFDVKPFSSASDAIDALENGLIPDIILIDIIMPQMNGLQFLEELSKRKLARTAKKVMLTNQSEQEHIKRAQELGVDKYIIKANTIPSEVVEIVRELINN